MTISAVQEQLLPLVITEHASSPWVISSQRAADLYESGANLWTKKHLRDIEQELAETRTKLCFALHRIDGITVHISNPLYGVKRPIYYNRRPSVTCQDYWHLVRVKPDGPPETYHCSYLVEWASNIQETFDGYIENYEAAFEERRQTWNDSGTCAWFKAYIRQVLGARKVSKVICFGLGDMTGRPPTWWRVRNALTENPDTESSVWGDSMTQHCIALTLAEVLRENARGTAVRLLTQDPKYSDKTARDLDKIGFEVVGRAGAGGFAELDDDSVVFSALTTAPVKQIIADIARSALIISQPPGEILGSNERLSTDPESPQTRQMWQEYGTSDFSVPPNDKSMEFLDSLKIFTRTANSPQ